MATIDFLTLMPTLEPTALALTNGISQQDGETSLKNEACFRLLVLQSSHARRATAIALCPVARLALRDGRDDGLYEAIDPIKGPPAPGRAVSSGGHSPLPTAPHAQASLL